MFDFLNFRKNYFVGVEFGTSAIKIVELSYKNQQINLENYGWVDLGLLPDSSNKSLEFQMSHDKKIKASLRKLIKTLNLKSQEAFVSLPGFSGLITMVDFPEMKKEDLEMAIQFEAHKYIPTPIEEVSLSWDIVSKVGTSDKNASQVQGPKRIQVVLVAAPKKDIMRYESAFQNSGLNISVIEIETFSLVRSLIGEDLGTFLIIDMGARATNIVLVEKGIIKANRNIDAGGNEVTNTIADSLNISKSRAEMLKKEKKDFLNSKELSVVIPTIELINNEALRIISAFQEKNKDARIDSLILSGGSAKMEGLDKYLSKSIGLKASLGDPWKRVNYDQKLKSFVEGIGSSYSVALGLAMRGIDEFKSK